ncbi:MAG: DUF3179 domain-containing protein [Thermoleophilaceae bacterium]|nr:DUF3179 domain-containing protein [Thermoleophilaceae bacterium]
MVGAATGESDGRDGARAESRGLEIHFDRSEWPRTDFARGRVPLSEFEGVGRRDGIDAIRRPRLVDQRRAERSLGPSEPVLVASVGRSARAYPLQILVWHEIVNDRLGGRPIAVTYCPLCNSSLIFERRVGGRTLEFEVSGVLRHSDLIMYDRQTESWWQQLTGRAVVGRLAGARLRALNSQVMGWRNFRARFPGARVLAPPRFYDRSYGRTPYAGYEDAGERPFWFYARPVDRRLPPKERVAAVFADRQVVVVPFSRLRRGGALSIRVGSIPVLVTLERRVLSVLDRADIGSSRPVGTAAAFDRRLGHRTLSFSRAAGDLIDDQTGSRWDALSGRAIAGPLRGRRLRPLRHDEQFWFALAAFYPRARIAR